MAEAAADLSTGDNLEQKILQVLSEAGGPVKTAQLMKMCGVSKKILNQVLYRLKEEAKVSLKGPATWCLGGDAPEYEAIAIPENPTSQPDLDERILRYLEANGPHKALHIAKALGMKTAKEVNPHLYDMRNRHLLSYDGQAWMIYASSQKELAHPRVRQESTAIIHQQNPINIIYQQGTSNHISISESEAIQIGHENTMLRQIACDQMGPRTQHPFPLTMPDEPSSQDTPPGAWGAQHIHMEKSMLRRVQLGHGNEMRLPRNPVEQSAYSFTGSPPVTATTADPGTSFNVHMPEPGPHPEGDTAQRVHIKSCLLEDATIGNSNKMIIHTASEAGVVESGDSEEPKEDTGSSSKAMPCGSCLHTPSNSMRLTSELRTITLEERSPKTIEPVLGVDGVSDTGSCRAQE